MPIFLFLSQEIIIHYKYLYLVRLIVFVYLLFSTALFAQRVSKEDKNGAIPNVVDSLYREDQFYIGLSFNLINNEPEDFTQNGFSGGLHLGFIRDMPINKKRNKAIGVGLGWSTNTYNTNLLISQISGEDISFELLDDNDQVSKNRFNTNLLEIPIQYRWRTSTPTNNSFWRIYTGIKLGYIFQHRARFESDDVNYDITDISQLNKLRYSATLTLGNGSFNAFVQYNLNPLFNDQAITVDGSAVNLQPIKFGIEFYLL